MNNELNNLIDKALEKAKQDLNNEKVEVNYTPEFLIELLEEIKEVANEMYTMEKKYSNVWKIKEVSSREEVANV